MAVSESVDKETGKKFLIPGDIVEVLDRNPSGLWLVRRISRSVEIGFVLDTILEEPKRYGYCGFIPYFFIRQDSKIIGFLRVILGPLPTREC